MHIEQLRDFCIAKKGVTEHFPFDDFTLVFKVMHKIKCLKNFFDIIKSSFNFL